MAKKVNKTEEQFANIEENLTKAGLYVEKNKDKLLKIVGSIIIIIALVLSYNTFIVEPNEKESISEMYIAEFYFQNNEYRKALNGDGQFSGFLTITDDYSSTDAGNLANYYSAICQMNLASSDSSHYYENAISSLNNFSTDDEIIQSLATGLIGDAYSELGNTAEALSYYNIAATEYINNFTTPYFMMKQANIHEGNGEYSTALDLYNSIKSDYPQSKQGQSIDKYISSASNR